jgi:hypothetical protein
MPLPACCTATIGDDDDDDAAIAFPVGIPAMIQALAATPVVLASRAGKMN